GSIRLGEVDMTLLSDGQRRQHRLARVGIVAQELELIEYLNARDNILLPYRLSRRMRPDAQARQRAAELAQRLGISGVQKRHPARLSEGERQRVAICRALMMRPQVVLADEPTGNLDEQSAQAALDLLFGQIRADDGAVVMVTHNSQILSRFD